MAEIKEDIHEECSKFGKILDVKIPRPVGGSRQSAGVGKIFVKYEDKESTKKALQALAGRKFADRTVVTTYFPEVSTCPSCTLSRSRFNPCSQENFDVRAL
jgi:splicing factor U2AF 65 kDa subunit